MNSDQQAIIKRIRRKAEIVKMNLKKDNLKQHDIKEILSLIDLLERS